MIQSLVFAFPIWIIFASATAFIYPEALTWFKGPLITYGLGFIMLSMGCTIKLGDFKEVARCPIWVLTGVLLQYTIMPLCGWMLAECFKLPTPYAVGLILVSCCPGGTASNVIAFLANANVALSVLMTLCSTLLAAICTPILTSVLVGDRLSVDVIGLFWSACQVVLFPVLLGIWIRHLFPRFTRAFSVYSPLVAVFFIAMIVGSILGDKKDEIIHSGFNLLIAVSLLHLIGFGLGYSIALFTFKNHQLARTISIEVGMQNSGLGVVLARNNFSNPLVAVPSALSSLVHCIIGSVLVRFWAKNKKINE